LYVDEVTLLPDALVDALLDAAASGVNTVARDGISQQHAARFVLVGTMNPEEGELRPQLLDRFGLSVTLANPVDAQDRTAILRARLNFDEDPQALSQVHAQAQQALSTALLQARALLPTLAWSDAVLRHAADLAIAAGVDGLRGDLVMLRAARALAALEGRAVVSVTDVDAVADLALAHRRSESASTPPSASSTPQSQAKDPSQSAPSQAPQRHAAEPPRSATEGVAQGQAPQGDWGAMPAEPEGLTRPPKIAGWPPKKA
jgi:magnesium chelatase subunit I